MLRRIMPARLSSIRMKAALLRALSIIAGGGAGFAYYYFIGCSSGTCPISSDPWISTAYGALIGVLATSGIRRKAEGETTHNR